MMPRYVKRLLWKYDKKFLKSKKKRHRISHLETVCIAVATEDQTGKHVSFKDPSLMHALIHNAWKVGFMVGYKAAKKDAKEKKERRSS